MTRKLLPLLLLALSAPAWGAYTYNRSILIKTYNGGSGGMVSGSADLASFTVYLKLTDATAFVAAGHIHHSVSFNGQSVPADFTLGTTSACASPYKFDIASWDQTNGVISAWVLINPLPHAADVTLYACYGDAGVTTYQGGTGAQSYDSYLMRVYHLENNGAALNVYDTITGSAASNVNGVGFTASGALGGGASFAGVGSSQYISGPTSLSTVASYTYSFWIKATASPSTAYDSSVFGTGFNPGYEGFRWDYYPNSSLTQAAQHTNNSGSYTWAQVATPLSGGVLYHITITKSGETLTAYLNGAYSSTVTGSGTGYWAGAGYDSIGSIQTSKYWYAGGMLDEVREQSTARSADWILTDYRAQSANGSYVVLGAESGGAPATVTMTPIIM